MTTIGHVAVLVSQCSNLVDQSTNQALAVTILLLVHLQLHVVVDGVTCHRPQLIMQLPLNSLLWYPTLRHPQPHQLCS